jgi:tetratricopeptide (TPR) repeat protein
MLFKEANKTYIKEKFIMNEDNETMNSRSADNSVDDNNYSQEDINNKADSQSEEFYDTSTNKHQKCQIPVGVILFLLVIVALDVISMIRFPKILGEYKIYKTAESRTITGETSLALQELLELAEKYPDSVPIITKNIELSMENGYYDTAGYLYDTYLTGMSLSDSEYDQMDKYSTRLGNYYATYDAVEQIFSTVSNIETMDEIKYEELITSLKALLEEEGLDYAYVYYYLGIIESDIATAKDYMQECYNIDPECFDVRVQLGVMYRRMGDYAEARQYSEEALAKEKLDSGALRSMAIIKMLEGDLESGLSYAEDAYNSDPEGTYVRETYLIALTMNDMKAEAKIIQDEILESGVTLDDDTLKLLNGEITLEDYYVEG